MPGLIPPATLEQIRAASDIVEIIGGYFPLKRAGANFVALCPFHREKSPSFNVNPHKQIFHCFGCHKGGDVFTFVQEYEHIPFMDAVRRLAERANIPLQLEDQPGQREARGVKESLLALHEQLTQRWQNCLANEAAGQLARDYLAKRGVSAEAVKRFRLGAAPEAWDDTVNWAKSKGFDLPLVEKGGLIIRKEESDRCYDRFRGRLMFPICDEQGRVVGFSGRVLSGDEKTAKYVNSPETPIFTKGRVIYGLDKAKRAMLDAGFVIVCEGQLDLIACHANGVENVVAPQGTALTADHARILKRYVNEVVLCFDSDNAGQNAAARSLDPLLGASLAIRVATVPAPHDPDSFIKAHGGPAFAELIGKAEGYFDYRLNRLCEQEDITSDRGRQTVLKEMAAGLLKSTDRVLHDTYARKTALRLGVRPEAVLAELKKAGKTRPSEPFAPEEAPGEEAASMLSPASHELWLLRILLTHDALAEWVRAHLDPQWVAHPAVRAIVAFRLQAEAEGSWTGMSSVLQQLDDEAARRFATEAVADTREIPNPEQQLTDIVTRLRNADIDRRLIRLSQQMENPQAGDDVKLALLHEQQELKRLKRAPLAAFGEA
jgi:DNA primase